MLLVACTAIEQEQVADNNNEYATTQMVRDNPTASRRYFNPGYETFEDMIEDSDLIIRGRVLDERVENVNVHITLEQAIEARMEEYEAGLITKEERDLQIAHHHEHAEDFAPHYEDVIFYRIEILEIFQGNYEVGDVIEIRQFMGWNELGNPSLEHSNRYEVESELILFLVNGRLGYIVFFPHQAVYEVPADLDIEEDVDVILDYIEELQRDYAINAYNISEPFDITLEILREIAEENDLID